MRNSNRMEHAMITNDKYREIASRLRYVANDELGGMSLQKRLAKELELENTSWRGVLRGIADLIDRPTCKNVADPYDGGLFECSECGMQWHILNRADALEEWAHVRRPKHCPSCGAYVRSTDE
mgnify:CR=1 FL=1